MEVNTREEKGIIIVTLEGEIDISVTDLIRGKFKSLIDEKRKVVIVDMSKVPYIDSSGLGMLVEVRQEMEKYGGEIRLMRLTPDVKKVFELTRLNNFFHIFDEEGSAMDGVVKDAGSQ